MWGKCGLATRLLPAGGKVFFIAKESRVAAINALTGAFVWENKDPAVIAMVGAEATGGSNDNGTSGFLYSPTTIVHSQPEDNNIVALSAASGSLLWSTGIDADRPYSKPKALLANEILLSYSSAASKKSWNILTNQTVPLYQGIKKNTNCGNISGSWNMLFSGAATYNLQKSEAIPFQGPRKASCGTPMFVSNGLAILPKNTDCECGRIRGMYLECSADNSRWLRICRVDGRVCLLS